MKMRKENILWNVLLGTGVYLLDSMRDRLSNVADDFRGAARETYGEASRRVGRATEAIRGEDHHHGMSTAAALLIGIGVGVGVGMLLAPASGEETRKDLSNRVHEFSDRMRDKFSSGEHAPTGTYGA
jgi:hypothetical protein